jgi:hypothetical protein
MEEGAAAEEEGAAAEEEGLRKVKLWSKFAPRRVIQYYCHSWLMNGEHAGWSGVSDLRNKVKVGLDLQSLPAHQTASDWLAKERTAFERHSAGKEVSHMPLLRKPEGGISTLLAALQEDNVLEDELLKEFKEQSDGLSWRRSLARSCRRAPTPCLSGMGGEDSPPKPPPPHTHVSRVLKSPPSPITEIN